MTTGGPVVEAMVREHGVAGRLDEIGAYIVRQRWSGARGSTVTDTTIADAAVLAEPDPSLMFAVAAVTFDGARTRSYALPLGLRRAGDSLAERAPDFMIGSLQHGGHDHFLYDALGDPAYIHWLWRSLRQRGNTPTANGAIRFECPDPDALEAVEDPSVRVLSAEQSNTSMILGDATFLKHLRRVEPGPSHELEMITTLKAAGFTHLAPLLGVALYEPGDEPATPLALVQPYLHNGTEGWSLALTSLRDLYADAEEAADPGAIRRFTTVDDQGGAFTGEASRLGAVTAEMHLALTQPGLGTDVEPVPLDQAMLQAWADTMTGELDALLASRTPALDPLRAARESVVERFDVLRTLEPGGLCTRVHGDLHLGQTMRIDSGWVILDFEGEPDRTPTERRARTSPLRDAAGMLRSFDYAAAVALADRMSPDSPEWEDMLTYGDAWAQTNRDAFWSAYLSTVGNHPLLPPPGTAQVIRRAFEVQKAVYEVGYELGHRPAWVGIPLRFLLRGAS